MTAGDLDVATAVSSAAFEIDLADPSTPMWRARVAYPLETDPDGALVAEREGTMVGVAQAVIRERVWVLTLLTIDPAAQGTGAGAALLAAALAYGDGLPGLIISSNDPRAMRLYAGAGFAVNPTVETVGQIDSARLPAADPAVVEGGPADLEALEAISREVRGAAHTPDIEFGLGAPGAQLLRHGERGFAVVSRGRLWMLAARDEDAARSLLWAAFARIGDGDGDGDGDSALVRWITADQQWAIQVAVAAGLRLRTYGALCVRCAPGPLRPFVPSGAFA
jgi:GNAT superfamily N-acetyltransferase